MKTPYDVIIAPVITEKSMDDAASKKYTFKVAKTANKTEIKNAVETAFGVTVEKVNTANYDGKIKRQVATRAGPPDTRRPSSLSPNPARPSSSSKVSKGGKTWESRNINRQHRVFAA